MYSCSNMSDAWPIHAVSSAPYAFIGLSPPDVADDVHTPPVLTSRPAPRSRSSERQLEPLARHYATENDRLAELLPDLDLSLWRAPR